MIKSFIDLDVYNSSYQASIVVITEIIPKLPSEEKFDLANQLRKSAKAIPRLIAEGYAKKHQKRGFYKYLDDAMGESNEMVVSLSHCQDLYIKNGCEGLIDLYDKIGKQLYRLKESWIDSANPQDAGRNPKRAAQDAIRKPREFRYELL